MFYFYGNLALKDKRFSTGMFLILHFGALHVLNKIISDILDLFTTLERTGEIITGVHYLLTHAL